ncbi:MAG: hypothetical protein IPH82_29885 [Chloroflexi bacterium]|nr:hypothetical protein [Chloroflexota bacterium]MBK7920324.1 hypothetical protein [Chloroflexota bacterium]MBK8935371.1 hypothetical protein [Chloroflexota bacterium]
MDTESGKRPLQRHNFILSLWQETGSAPDGQPVWRFRLEDPQTSERYGFIDLAALTHFLVHWAANPPVDEQENAH